MVHDADPDEVTMDIDREIDAAAREVDADATAAIDDAHLQRRTVPVDADDYREAKRTHEQRSAPARSVDRNRRAKLATDADEWKGKPDRTDIPGVDTPPSIGVEFTNAGGFNDFDDDFDAGAGFDVDMNLDGVFDGVDFDFDE